LVSAGDAKQVLNQELCGQIVDDDNPLSEGSFIKYNGLMAKWVWLKS